MTTTMRAEMRGEEGLQNGEIDDGDGGGAAGTTATIRERTRIFVGGLGGSVTEEDLRKTFSTLGEVVSVDIIRTKGRGFAYLDFLPSSDKSVAKLFSTYNGCTWKGGKLRLEKAKEHYLLRLRREGQEDAKHASDASSYNADVSEKMASSEKPKRLPSSDKMQLRIFFPKLMKMKSLAFGGSGKHKYSFQRVEVPSMSIHFCDCEEHSGPSLITKEKTFSDRETASGGVNEEELSIMKSVMKKLFEREHCSKAAHIVTESGNEGDNSVNSNDDLLADENEADHMTDEDNLIINIVGGKKDRIALLGSKGQEMIMANQEPKFKKLQTSKDRPAQNMRDNQKKKDLAHSKKRKSSYSEEGDGKEILSYIPETTKSSQIHSNTQENRKTELESGTQQLRNNSLWSQKSAWRDLIGQKGNSPFSISDIVPSVPCKKEDEPKTDDLDMPSRTDIENENLEKHGNAESQSGRSKELKKLAEASLTAKQNEVMNRSGRGASWLHKSSWTQLVGNANNIPFRISQVLPGLPSEKHEVQLDSIRTVNYADGELYKSQGDCSDALPLASSDLVIPLAKHDDKCMGIEHRDSEKEAQVVAKKNEVSASSAVKKQPSELQLTSLGNFKFEETCPFMRSDASMKEWKKAKAALSASFKKKEKDKFK